MTHTKMQIRDVIRRARADADVVRKTDPNNTLVGQLLLYADIIEEQQRFIEELEEMIDAKEKQGRG